MCGCMCVCEGCVSMAVGEMAGVEAHLQEGDGEERKVLRTHMCTCKALRSQNSTPVLLQPFLMREERRMLRPLNHIVYMYSVEERLAN